MIYPGIVLLAESSGFFMKEFQSRDEDEVGCLDISVFRVTDLVSIC